MHKLKTQGGAYAYLQKPCIVLSKVESKTVLHQNTSFFVFLKLQRMCRAAFHSKRGILDRLRARVRIDKKC